MDVLSRSDPESACTFVCVCLLCLCVCVVCCVYVCGCARACSCDSPRSSSSSIATCGREHCTAPCREISTLPALWGEDLLSATLPVPSTWINQLRDSHTPSLTPFFLPFSSCISSHTNQTRALSCTCIICTFLHSFSLFLQLTLPVPSPQILRTQTGNPDDDDLLCAPNRQSGDLTPKRDLTADPNDPRTLRFVCFHPPLLFFMFRVGLAAP